MNKFWFGIASNAKGTVLMAGEYTGRFYVSLDSGATWTEQRPGADIDGTWYAVGLDDLGVNAIAACRDKRLYTIFNPPPAIPHSFPWVFRFQLTHKKV
jgi:hypothetical protein